MRAPRPMMRSTGWADGWERMSVFLPIPNASVLMIAFAPLLWSWRGTPLGLITLLRLALDECVDETLFEPLRTGRMPEGTDPTAPRLIETFLTRAFSPVGAWRSVDYRSAGPGAVGRAV